MTDFVKCSDGLKENVANILWLEREIGIAGKGLSQKKVIYCHNNAGPQLPNIIPRMLHMLTTAHSPEGLIVLTLFPLYFRLSTGRLSNLPRITRLISSRASQVLFS